jgi:hypothetical protein
MSTRPGIKPPVMKDCNAQRTGLSSYGGLTMDDDDIFIGHVFYGIGSDDGGFYVAVRLQWPDLSSRTFVAEARFQLWADAVHYMEVMEADGLQTAMRLGLDMTRDKGSQN